VRVLAVSGGAHATFASGTITSTGSRAQTMVVYTGSIVTLRILENRRVLVRMDGSSESTLTSFTQPRSTDGLNQRSGAALVVVFPASRSVQFSTDIHLVNHVTILSRDHARLLVVAVLCGS